MKIQEIRELTTPELEAKVYELKGELMTLRFQQRSGELSNGKKLADTRHDIARILTVINERKMAESK